MQIKTQLNWDQNCIFAELNELDVKSAMFDIAEFWVSDFESVSINSQTHTAVAYIFHFTELDKLTSQLETKEKKIKESDSSIYCAKEEIQNLNRRIAEAETQLKINEQNFGPKAAALTKESAK